MNNKRKTKTLYLCRAALIAAIYVVLTLFSSMLGLSSGVIQVRLSEMLCILPIFTPSAIPGLAVGCLCSNLLTGAIWQDILFGTLATLLGAIGTHLLRKFKWLAPIPPVISNTVIVPFVLAYAYKYEGALPFFMLTVGIGEIISIYLLGMVLYHALEKKKHYLFD
ncbi:MAG: QueT transporter family protein [Ruminococcaceae bacterium]|nr:QueT transporter family protein [Oscillospiraceae bacterium]